MSQPPSYPSRLQNRDHRHAVTIPMRDGAALAADLWLPQKPGRHPAILVMTPYSRMLIGAALPDPTVELDLPDSPRCALVAVDWRGYFDSKRAAGLRRPTLDQHGQDGYDVIEWIATQPWSNGKVAMWGPSACGKVQYAVAAERPPHLACIVPMAAAYGYRYEQYYYGGVLRRGYLDTLGKAGHGPQNLVAAHPLKDRFWERIESTARGLSTIDVPVLLMTGWFDLDAGAILDTCQRLVREGGPAARQNTRLLVGPWHHLSFGKLKQGDLEYPEAQNWSVKESTRFIEHYLLGEPPLDDAPRVRLFQTGTNRWLGAAQFPPPPGPETVLRLAPDRRLAAPGQIPDGSDAFRDDPASPSPTIGGMNAFMPRDPLFKTVGAGPRDQRPVENRADCVVYTGPELPADVALGGSARMRLFVASQREDSDWAVRLCDVDPDGRSMLVSDGIQRMSLRNGTSRSDPVEPGRIAEVSVRLEVASHVFRKGHRIRAIVSASNYPRFDAGPPARRGLFARRGPSPAEHRIHFGTDRPSALVLPSWRETQP